MYRITQDQMSNQMLIVSQEYGEIRRSPEGNEYVYLPLPIARIPIGYGRDAAQAEIAAVLIVQALHSAYGNLSTFAQLLENYRDK